MRKLLALGSLLVVSLPLVAVAQPPPPPPPPPGGGGGGGYEPSEPKMRFDVSLIAGLPQGDFDNVDTSPGIGLAFGYTVVPNVSIFAGIRYFAIQVDGGSEIDYSNYDFQVGGRYAVPVSPTAKVFGEAMLLFSTLEAEFGGESRSESGIGFGARGGGVFNVSGNIGIGGAVSFTTATIDIQGFDVDAAWLGIDGFVSFGF